MNVLSASPFALLDARGSLRLVTDARASPELAEDEDARSKRH